MKAFSFKLDEKADAVLIDKLDHMANKAEFFREIVKMYFDQKLKPENPIDDKIKAERLTLLKMERAHKVKKIQETVSKTKLNDAQRGFIESYGKPLSQSGSRILRAEARPLKSSDPIVNKRQNTLTCNYCKTYFQYRPLDRDNITRIKDIFIDHYFKNHNTGLTNSEMQELKNL